MANDETKSVTTSHEEEQMIIEKHEQFGWSLHSSQEVLSQTAHSTDMGYYVQHTTTTTNYVKLIFKRDRDFPHARERAGSIATPRCSYTCPVRRGLRCVR